MRGIWPPLPVERTRETCGKPQRWCDDIRCSPVAGAPVAQGHWTHLSTEASDACRLMGGRIADTTRRATS